VFLVAPLKNQQGFLKNYNQSKANILNEQFKSVFTTENHTNFPDKGPGPFPSMTNINITEQGVYKLLKNQKPHKATGPDEVPAFILRSAAQQLCTVMKSCDSQDRLYLKPCCVSDKMLLASKCYATMHDTFHYFACY
jgi:hypothetical protein